MKSNKSKILPLAISAMLLNSFEAKAEEVLNVPSEVLTTISVDQYPKDSISAIERGVKRVIAKQLNVKESAIKRTSDLVNDLGADSLDVVEIVMSIEKEFNLTISDEELEKIKKVSNLITIIEKERKKK